MGQFQNNVPQWEIVKPLILQYIISSRDSENLENCLCVREQGQNSTSGDCDPSALRCHCIKNRFCRGNRCFPSGMLSTSTVHKCRLKLSHAKKKPSVNTNQKYRHLIRAKAHWKTVLCSHKSKFEIRSSRLKRRGTISLVIGAPFYSLRLYGSASLSVEFTASTSGKAPSMLGGIYRFQNNIWSHPEDAFCRDALVYFSKTVHLLQQHGFVVEASGCWTDLPAVPTFHQVSSRGTSGNEPMRILHQTRRGQKPCSCSPQSLSHWPLLKEEGRRAAVIKLKMILFKFIDGCSQRTHFCCGCCDSHSWKYKSDDSVLCPFSWPRWQLFLRWLQEEGRKEALHAKQGENSWVWFQRP